jgi:beta-glucosidase
MRLLRAAGGGPHWLGGSAMMRTTRSAFIGPGGIGSIFVFICLSSPDCGSSVLLPSAFNIPQASFRSVHPPPFWWGVSASSYQTEDKGTSIGGKGFATDWDLFKEMGGVVARDDRVASYSNFERDLTALKRLGVTHYRFSIEWARVEPSPGAFDDSAIEHYVTLVRRLREEGIEPIVCLWHFTFPDWLCDFEQPSQHGWLNPGAADAWGLYVTTMSQRLAPYVEVFAPQNEPNAYALGMMLSVFPPGRLFDEAYYDELTQAEVRTFLQAASIIRAARADAKIISIQNIIHWQRDTIDWLGLYDKALAYNYRHLDGIAGAIDYLGFNYYQSEIASPLSILWASQRTGVNVSDMGWFIDPEGLEIEIVELSQRYRLPLIITENGIAAGSDQKRQLYLSAHLQAVRKTLDANYDVRGYFHWTLMDCFEWTGGYGPQFGLHTVDARSNTLLPKASADLYRSFIAGRVMDSDIDPSTLDSATRVAMSDR